jgi:predicted cupin superfamily sugar epimerase
MTTYKEVIEILNLVPLAKEGGFFRETYRSNRFVNSDVLGRRSESTAIYYLITEYSFSSLHLVDQDEIFHFYAGSPVEMLQIDQNGNHQLIMIGNNIFGGERPQVVAPYNVWQGTKLKNPKEGAWALLGCTVSPGFEYENFHIKSRNELIKDFPHLKNLINAFTNP